MARLRQRVTGGSCEEIPKPYASLVDGGQGPGASLQAAADQDKLFHKSCSTKIEKEESFQQHLLASVTQEGQGMIDQSLPTSGTMNFPILEGLWLCSSWRWRNPCCAEDRSYPVRKDVICKACDYKTFDILVLKSFCVSRSKPGALHMAFSICCVQLVWGTRSVPHKCPRRHLPIQGQTLSRPRGLEGPCLEGSPQGSRQLYGAP